MDSELRLRMRAVPTGRVDFDVPIVRRPPVRHQAVSRHPLRSQPSQKTHIGRPASKYKAMAASNKIISELTDLQYIRSANTRFFKRRRVIVSSFVIVTTLIVTAAGLMLFGKSATTNQQRQPSLVAGLSKPNFNPILPTGGPMYNDQESSVKFSSATDSYSFDDTFLGAPILVFEQPLQTNKQSSADQLISTIASKIGANVPLNYSYGTAYLTGSSASNKQMLIFNDNGILVFIQSKLNIEANAWPQYIDKLYHA